MRSVPKSVFLVSILLLSAGLLASPAHAKRTPSTYTGTVTDAMCGAHHMPGQEPAACTRACVKQGSMYALVVGGKVYKLKGGDAAELDRLAGARATVKGTLSGDTIEVTSVTAAQ